MVTLSKFMHLNKYSHVRFCVCVTAPRTVSCQGCLFINPTHTHSFEFRHQISRSHQLFDLDRYSPTPSLLCHLFGINLISDKTYDMIKSTLKAHHTSLTYPRKDSIAFKFRSQRTGVLSPFQQYLLRNLVRTTAFRVAVDKLM